MPFQHLKQTVGKIPSLWRAVRGAIASLFRNSSARSRLFIVVSGVLGCAYALGVISYVLSMPDIGVRCTFSAEVDHFFPEFLFPEGQPRLHTDDVIVKIGSHPV